MNGMTTNSTCPRLSRATAPGDALALGCASPEVGIVHLGLGNFHRAHLAPYTAQAMAQDGGEWGILAYSRSSRIPRLMREQDCLYSVVEIGPGSDRAVIPGVHRSVACGAEGTSTVISALADESTKIVSLTVTEAGYCINQRTGNLDTGDAGVRADLEGDAPPVTAIGLLAHGLAARAEKGGMPITVISCDNVAGNGDHVAKALRQFSSFSPRFSALAVYLDDAVSFPNSMVDRIVPASTPAHRELAARRLGVWDEIAVAAEPFSMWALEDRFVAGRPSWEKVGVTFTDEVASYEVLKLRLLNGTHSLIAYLGALAGRTTIPEARFTPAIEEAARMLIEREYMPTLTVPSGLDAGEYVNQLFVRWSNTVLADRVARVGSDGSMRLPQRVTEPIRFHAQQGQVPQAICLTIAGYLECLAPMAKQRVEGEAARMSDPLAPVLRQLASESSSPHAFVRAVFERSDLFAPDLVQFPDVVDRVGDYLQILIQHDVAAAVAAVRESYS